MLADPSLVGGKGSVFIHPKLFVHTLFLGHFAIAVSFIGLFCRRVNTSTHAFAFAGNSEDDQYG